MVIQEATGIPVSATFNNKFISPNYQNMKIWIDSFKPLYDIGIRSVTWPFTSWLMFGEIQKVYPDLYIKNTILWALQRQERQCRRQKCFLRCLSLWLKTKSHIRHLDNLLLKCSYKGGRVYAKAKILLGNWWLWEQRYYRQSE